jgi:hypothetical protein
VSTPSTVSLFVGSGRGGEYSSTPSVALTPSLVRACRRIFAVFDANGDGLLDFDELMRVSTLDYPCEYPCEYYGVPLGGGGLLDFDELMRVSTLKLSTPVSTPVSTL